jgi:hypothetical protein
MVPAVSGRHGRQRRHHQVQINRVGHIRSPRAIDPRRVQREEMFLVALRASHDLDDDARGPQSARTAVWKGAATCVRGWGTENPRALVWNR